MIRRLLLFALVTTSALLPPNTAAAQRWHRSGFWFENGSGPASVRIGCSGCPEVTRRSGTGGFLRFGAALSDRIAIGLESFSLINELFGFGEGDESLKAENSSLAGIALWYPWKQRLFIKSGVGIGVGEFSVTAPAAQPLLADGVGVSLTFGAGLDVPIWRSFALTANAGVWFTAIGDIVLPTARVDDVIATLYSINIGFAIR